ncbi:MAG TPA: caspase family protein, partial [Longimicrobium sp.]|nr:caspase family protein [Longimicrobium sp.]
TGYPLRNSEINAWGMAGLAEQAGYESLLVLRGREATRKAVHDALTAAAGSLARGDILLVYFSGHGCLEADSNCDEGHGWDETLCLYDGEIVDDQLAGYWRLFQPGVRILVVADGCHSGGACRGDEDAAHAGYARRAPWATRRAAPVYRSGSRSAGPADHAGPRTRSAGPADYAGSCIGAPPNDTDGIHASVLLLAAAREDQKAQDGLFTRHLLEVWEGGAFTGTFCDLYRQVRDRVMAERPGQEPQILMLGSPDPGFPLERAFHLEHRGAARRTAYR